MDWYSHWNNHTECCGVVLANDRVVKLNNIHPDPSNGFAICSEELDELMPLVTAFWHTHPSGCINLSLEDYYSFLKFPAHQHIIVGDQRHAVYYVVRGVVYRYD